LEIGKLEVRREKLSLGVSDLNDANIAPGGAILLPPTSFAPGRAILGPPPTLLEQEELGGREQTEGCMSIIGSEALKIGEKELETETLSLRILALKESNFSPEGAIHRPPGPRGFFHRGEEVPERGEEREERKKEEGEEGALRSEGGDFIELAWKSGGTAGKPEREPEGVPYLPGDNKLAEQKNAPSEKSETWWRAGAACLKPFPRCRDSEKLAGGRDRGVRTLIVGQGAELGASLGRSRTA
jgi:hypothetical protein